MRRNLVSNGIIRVIKAAAIKCAYPWDRCRSGRIRQAVFIALLSKQDGSDLEYGIGWDRIGYSACLLRLSSWGQLFAQR